MTPEEYRQYVAERAEKSPVLKNTAFAFMVGGLICVLGQAVHDGWEAAGLDAEALAVSVALIR